MSLGKYELLSEIIEAAKKHKFAETEFLSATCQPQEVFFKIFIQFSAKKHNFLYNMAIIDQQDLTFLKAHVSVERHIGHAAMQAYVRIFKFKFILLCK
jgi:hypothetical protein